MLNNFFDFWLEVSNYITLYLIVYFCLSIIIKFSPKIKSYIYNFEFIKKIIPDPYNNVVAWHYGCLFLSFFILWFKYSVGGIGRYYSFWESFVWGTYLSSLVIITIVFFKILIWLCANIYEYLSMLLEAFLTPVTATMEFPINKKNLFLRKRYNSAWVIKIRTFIDNNPTLFGREPLPKDGDVQYSFNNGDFYRGSWKNGKRDGHGEYIVWGRNKDLPDYVHNKNSLLGSYSGEWKNNLMHGKGGLHLQGKSYWGNFENGAIDENNVGIRYSFEDNQRKFIGKTKNLEMWDGTIYEVKHGTKIFDKRSKIISKVVKGKEEVK